MNRVVLQIPIDKSLRSEAEVAAISQGFSSLQEAVRVFVKRLADKKISVSFEETIQLSPKAIKRYDKMTDDIISGKAKLVEVNSTAELMKHLNSEN